MWQQYSQWTGEARNRYEQDIAGLQRVAGTSAETRQQAIAKREAEFSKEMSDLEGGATGSQLRQLWEQEGSPGTMETFLSGRYGPGWQSPEQQQASPSGPSRRAAAAGDPRAAVAAPVTGVGSQRPWWGI